MAGNRISRNAPCPCGSGKKFKHCCYGKDIDWGGRPAAPRLPRPRPSTAASLALLGPFRVVDAKLTAIAEATPGAAGWKAMAERLADTTAPEERMETYKAVRQAGVLPDDASFFLFGHAIQWLPSGEDLDRHEVAALRRFGLDDLADLYARDQLEYERRYERGRQFFYGPPDAELTRHLKERGVID
jgi:hypothetical protein